MAVPPDSKASGLLQPPEMDFSEFLKRRKGLQEFSKKIMPNVDSGKWRPNEVLKGTPLIAYAISANDKRTVAALLSKGADINALSVYGNPCLFGAISNYVFDGTEMLRFLLSKGANATLRSADERTALSACTNAVMRHWVSLALTDKPSWFQTLQLCKLDWLQGIQFSVIGQSLAREYVRDAFIHWSLAPDQKPLVFVFCGPSGHGKTKLAEAIGEIAGAPCLKVRCEIITRPDDLFGAKAPAYGSQKGSELNNFLAENDKKRAVVLLDEFEKMPSTVREGFLNIFAEGMHEDYRRREGAPVNAKNIIWVLTTNAADPAILKHFFDNPSHLVSKTEEQRGKFLNVLAAALSSEFGHPLFGRVSKVCPFVPFTETEQALVAEELMLNLREDFLDPQAKRPDSPMHPVKVVYVSQQELVKALVANYRAETGARSLELAVRHQIGEKVTRAWVRNSPPPDTLYVHWNPSTKSIEVTVTAQLSPEPESSSLCSDEKGDSSHVEPPESLF